MSLLFNMLSRFVIAFLPRSKCLLISWLQSPYDPAILLQSIHPDKALIWKDTCNILKECVHTSCISDRWLLPSHLRYQICLHILPAICRPLVHTLCNHILSWKWSRSVVYNSLRPHGLQTRWLLCPWDFPGKSTGMGCHCLLQGIFPTQGLNPGLTHCRRILYHLSHQGSPYNS